MERFKSGWLIMSNPIETILLHQGRDLPVDAFNDVSEKRPTCRRLRRWSESSSTAGVCAAVHRPPSPGWCAPNQSCLSHKQNIYFHRSTGSMKHKIKMEQDKSMAALRDGPTIVLVRFDDCSRQPRTEDQWRVVELVAEDQTALRKSKTFIFLLNLNH